MKSKKISFYFLSVFWYVYIVGKLGSFNHVIEGVFLNNIFILSHLLGLKMFNIRLWKTKEIVCAKEIEMDLASWKRIHLVRTPRGRNFIDLALYLPLER